MPNDTTYRNPVRSWILNAPLAAFIALLVICMLGGGASRGDVLSLVYVRPAAIICIAFLLLLPLRREFRPLRAPLILLGGLALLMCAQLVPLPPSLWASLPGHDRYAELVALSDSADAWRPLSLTPDLTIGSLLTLAFPLAGLLAYASMTPPQRALLLPILLIAACASALFGIVQVTGNPHGPAFLYNITHEGSSVGFFANRNHQAVFLAISFPMLRAWTLMPHPDAAYARLRAWIALGVGTLLVPLLLVTGSRAGIFLGIVGILAAYLLAPRNRLLSGFQSRTIGILFLAIPIALTGFVILLGRAIAIDRLISLDYLAAEARVEFAPITLAMARDFFPFGTGFGAFDAVFRGYEPDATLSPQYLNHAHNDLIELAITGGLPALILLLILLVWMTRRIWFALRAKRGGATALRARLAAATILILFLQSLVDYPLRTPLLALVFAILCGWLSDARRTSGEVESAAKSAPPD